MGQRVLIADDDGLLRDAFRTALELEGFEVVGEAGDVEEAAFLTETLGPDVVLMDPALPTTCDAGSAIDTVRRRCPETRIVVPGMHEDASIMARALAAGAGALLTKFVSMTEVVSLVRDADDGAAASVTKREAEILRLVATGYSTREVGDHLFISEKTVRNHLASLFRKLDARNRTEAVYRGIRLGIVPLR